MRKPLPNLHKPYTVPGPSEIGQLRHHAARAARVIFKTMKPKGTSTSMISLMEGQLADLIAATMGEYKAVKRYDQVYAALARVMSNIPDPKGGALFAKAEVIKAAIEQGRKAVEDGK